MGHRVSNTGTYSIQYMTYMYIHEASHTYIHTTYMYIPDTYYIHSYIHVHHAGG